MMWFRHLILLLLSIGIPLALLLLLINQEVDLVYERLSHQARLSIDQQRAEMETEFRHISMDLRYLAGMEEITAVLGGHKREMPGARETVARHFLNFILSKNYFDQIRLLDADGQERVRVNYNHGEAEVVPDRALQSKAHRYYFRNSIASPSDAIYVSPFDLNVENGQIEVPLKPTIRFSAPIQDQAGGKIGVVVANYLGTTILDRLKVQSTEFPGEVLLLNHHGGYLKGFMLDQSWGFMFPGREKEQFSRIYPAVWSSMQHQSKGQIKTPDGDIYTYSRVWITPTQDADCGNCYLWVVNRLSKDLIDQQVEEHIAPFAPAALMILLLLLAGSVYLMWTTQQRHRANRLLLDAISRLKYERGLFEKGPAVLFHWRNEFGWPVNFVSENLKQVLGYSPDTFLSGELGFASIVMPDDLQRITNELTSALKSQLDHFDRSPYRVVDADGKIRWVRDAVRVIHDKEDRVTEFYSYVFDISDLKQAEEELERSRAYVQKLVDTIPDPTLVIDVESFDVISANKAARETYLVGNKSRVEGLTCYQISHKTDKPCSGTDEPCPVQSILETKQPVSVVHRHFNAQGEPFFVEVNATPLLDDEGRVIQILESHRDITQHIETKQALQARANIDSLTGALSRAKFEEILEIQISKARSTGDGLGIIMFDLDHFKPINDTYGHDIGDKVLQETVQLVLAHIRDSDMLARWGGEEFLILLPRAELQGVEKVAEALRQAIDSHEFPMVGKVTVSLGATVWSHSDSKESLIKRADMALYTSKEAGRNRVTILAPKD